MKTSILMFLLTLHAGLSAVVFHDKGLQEAYEEARTYLDKPLYDIKQIESDINAVETILRNSKAPSFMIGAENASSYYKKECPIAMYWDGFELGFVSLFDFNVSIQKGSDEAKYRCHCQLPYVLKAAQLEIKKGMAKSQKTS